LGTLRFTIPTSSLCTLNKKERIAPVSITAEKKRRRTRKRTRRQTRWFDEQNESGSVRDVECGNDGLLTCVCLCLTDLAGTWKDAG